VGRAGTLLDWEGEVEDRVYATMYRAESILNWRVERVNGRSVLTLLVLQETTSSSPLAVGEPGSTHPHLTPDPSPRAERGTGGGGGDEFESELSSRSGCCS